MALNLMLQGTMSNAGKSLLAAGLCRVLSRDGLRVTPFKSQNMALNSGVTADGLEMGRAQIMQAEACGIVPDVRMNPILLKPESDHRSQLIVAGKAQGAFAARDYFARKKALMPQILEAFDSLASSTGEDTARASPMLTMSFSARLISAGLPAPSMTMTSFSAARLS